MNTPKLENNHVKITPLNLENYEQLLDIVQQKTSAILSQKN